MATPLSAAWALPSSMPRRSARYRSRAPNPAFIAGCCSADNREYDMAEREIDAIRALLGSKPRPVGWSERRQRLDEVGSAWPVASDVKCGTVDCDGVAGEWSIVPGSAPSRVLLYFHGGGYCSGSIVSHRRLVT